AWGPATRPVRAWFIYLEHHGPMLADSITYRTLFSVFAGVFLGFAIGGIWLSGNPGGMGAIVGTTSPPLLGLIGAAMGAVGSLRIAFRTLADQPDDQTFFVWVLARDLLLAIGFGAPPPPRAAL